jgi:excisionase family DNA binding protein
MTDHSLAQSGGRLLLTIQEVAELTGFSVGTLYHFISQRRIPFVRISSRCVRFERSALDSWIAAMVMPVKSFQESSLRFKPAVKF